MSFSENPKFHMENENGFGFSQIFCKSQEHDKSIKQDT